MLERLQISLNISTKDKYLYSRLNDKCNDAFGFIFAFTNSFAPILGSVIEENVGPQVTCDIHWCFFVFYGVIIFTFNCGPNFRKENQEFQAKLAELKPEFEAIQVEKRASLAEKHSKVVEGADANEEHEFVEAARPKGNTANWGPRNEFNKDDDLKKSFKE